MCIDGNEINLDGDNDHRRMGKWEGTLPEIKRAEQGCKNSWNSLTNEFTLGLNSATHEGGSQEE